MKTQIAASILAMIVVSSGASAATWEAAAVLNKYDLTPSSGSAKVADGVYSEVTTPDISASRVSGGTVEVNSVLGDRASASLEGGSIELLGVAPSGATTAGRIFDTLTDFATHGGPLYMMWQIDFGVDPYGNRNYSDVPIANLGLSISGGGVSYGFSSDIYGCEYTNNCRTTGQLTFPKTTTSVEIGMSMSAFRSVASQPVIHDYFANLNVVFAEICETGPFLTCRVSYESASGHWLENVAPMPIPALVPVPPAVVMLGSALAGLAGIARRRRAAAARRTI